jgi:AraC-like DNA-binding protein
MEKMLHDESTTMREYTVGTAWVRRLLDALSAVGFDARAYCRRRGWDLDRLDESEWRLPWAETSALWQAAARATGDPHLGLHAAASLPDRAGSAFGYLMASSPTLLEAVALMVRYQALHFDGNALSLDERDDHMALRVSLPSSMPSSAHQTEYICVLLKRACTMVVGPTFGLLGVDFRHAGPTNATEHERIFECPVRFRQSENALLVPRRMLSRTSLFANPDIFESVRAIAERRLAELGSPDCVRQVRKALAPLLSGACRVEDVAKQLGLSRRSLQRRLAAEGTSFATVLDQTRRARARAHPAPTRDGGRDRLRRRLCRSESVRAGVSAVDESHALGLPSGGRQTRRAVRPSPTEESAAQLERRGGAVRS